MLLLACVMLGMIGVAIAMLWDMRTDVWRNAVVASGNLAEAESANLDRELWMYAAALEAADTRDARFAVPVPLDRLQRRDPLADTFASALLGPIRIINAQGVVVPNSGNPTPAPATDAELAALAAHRDHGGPELLVGALHRSRTGAYGIELSRRITLANGQFGGVACGVIRLDVLTGRFRQLQIGPHDVVSLLSIGGTMLAHAPGDPLVGRSIAGTDVLRRLDAARKGSFQAPGGIDGIRRQFTFAHVGDWPLVMVVGVSLSDLFAAWRERAITIGVLLAMMATSGAVLLLLIRREMAFRLAAEAAERRSKDRYRALADSTSDVLVGLRPDGVSSHVSPSIRSFGHAPDELTGRDARDWIRAEDVAAFESALAASLAGETGVLASYRIRRKNGSWCWVEARFNRLRDGGALAVLRDIDARKTEETALETIRLNLARLTTTDPLTGLGNRRALDDGLEAALRQAADESREITVLIADIDWFKAFNDRYGHLAGDDALRAVGQAVSAATRRPDDLAVRFGGEEFAVVLPDTDLAGGVAVAQAIRERVSALDIPHETSPIGRVSISIGVSTLRPSRHGPMDVAFVLEHADEALYAAKRHGRDRVFTHENCGITASALG